MHDSIKLSPTPSTKRRHVSDVDTMARSRKSARNSVKTRLDTPKTSIKKAAKLNKAGKVNNSAKESHFNAKGKTLCKDSVTVNVTPTSNYYDPLKNNSKEYVVTNERRIRIPPITLSNVKRDDVTKLMELLGIKNYDTKLLKFGIQVFCKSTENFNSVNEFLVQNKCQFYTHDLPSDKLFKVVLRGLHKMDVKDLNQELNALNIKPERINIISPKNVRYADHVNYIIYFKKGEIKLDDLRQTRSLFHTVVTWEPYRINRTGPIQCSRCQRPGHGARHCNMSPRCEFCAEEHESKHCPRMAEIERKAREVSAQGKNSIDLSVTAKCCNCDQLGHFASDPGCPKKRAYADRRKKRSVVGKKHERQETKLSEADFPPLRQIERPSSSHVSSANHSSYAEQAKHTMSNNFPNFGFQNSSMQFQPSGFTSKIEDPFSFEEVMSLTSDILTSLRNVKTASREDIIMSVMQISLKYLFDNGSR